MNKRYIILDCSSIMVPLKFTLGSFNHEPKDLRPITLGFFNKVMALSKMFSTTDLIFVWEGKKYGVTPYRKQLFDGYKVPIDKHGEVKEDKRTDEEKDFDRACAKHFDGIRKMVEDLGFKNSFSQIGTESDDVMAMICEQDEHTKHDFIMATGDEDMLQCLKNENTNIYFVSKKKLFTKQNMLDEKGIDPALWHMVKAIGGCKSDWVPGVKGVAEKKAISYLNGDMKEHLKSFQAIKDFPSDLRLRNKRLVTLPIPQTRPVTLVEEDDLSFEKFVSYCMEFGYEEFINEQYETWQKFYSGAVDPARQRLIERKRRKNNG